MAFMFESRYVFEPSAFALDTPALQKDYDGAWSGFSAATLK
jgi:homogentisate 1,2-dioxygenase